MARTELDAAYEHCRAIHREHGRSYYLATQLLPAAKRPHVHALYAFTRRTDDIVDDSVGLADGSESDRQDRLDAWSAAFLAGLAGGPVDDPVLLAVLHTAQTYRLDPADFDVFLRSMAMDLKVTDYPTYDDLLGYMEGSAAAIGTLMLPILGVTGRGEVAPVRESARQLGLGFQLTNFIRDVREDLERGRVYLPESDLARFGLSRADLYEDAAAGVASAPLRALVAFEIERAREHYRAARPGLARLEPRSRACVRAAYVLYGAILDEIARADHDVLRGRAVVPRRRRLVLLARSLRLPPTAIG